MRFISLLGSFLCCIVFAQAQYTIKDKHTVACSAIKDQQNTGTCWSFATSSFLESELMRMHGKEIDLSEMYSVYATYQDKARNYLLRQGKLTLAKGRCLMMSSMRWPAMGLSQSRPFQAAPRGWKSTTTASWLLPWRACWMGLTSASNSAHAGKAPWTPF